MASSFAASSRSNCDFCACMFTSNRSLASSQACNSSSISSTYKNINLPIISCTATVTQETQSVCIRLTCAFINRKSNIRSRIQPVNNLGRFILPLLDLRQFHKSKFSVYFILVNSCKICANSCKKLSNIFF